MDDLQDLLQECRVLRDGYEKLAARQDEHHDRYEGQADAMKRVVSRIERKLELRRDRAEA